LKSLNDLLIYDPSAGRFRWKCTDTANRRIVGDLVGSTRGAQIRYTIDGVDYKHQQLLELLVPNLLCRDHLFLADLMILESNFSKEIAQNLKYVNPAAYQLWKAAFCGE